MPTQAWAWHEAEEEVVEGHTRFAEHSVEPLSGQDPREGIRTEWRVLKLESITRPLPEIKYISFSFRLLRRSTGPRCWTALPD
jgi:hypothetical protein